MPEQQQPEVKSEKPFYFIQWIKNVILHDIPNFSRQIQKITGVPLRYRKYKGQTLGEIEPVRLDLLQREAQRRNREQWETVKENLIHLMRIRSREVNKIEANWRWFDWYDPKTSEKGKLQQIEDIYAKATIYLDPSLGIWEYPLYEKGISQKDLELKDEEEDTSIFLKEDVSDEKPLTDIDMIYDEYTISVGKKEYKYPVPGKCRMRYPIAGMNRNWIVEISPFGYRRMGLYIGLYTKIITSICDEYSNELIAEEEAGNNDPQVKQDITNWIRAVRTAYSTFIGQLLLDYCGGVGKEASKLGINARVERRARSFVRQRAVEAVDIKTIRDAMLENKGKMFRENNMIYLNSYITVQPVIYGKRYHNATVIDELKKYGGSWYKKPDEIDHGLDKWGFPLEVDEDGYVLLDKRDEDGKETPRGSWRQLPGGKNSKFKNYIDTLELANYLTNMHDTYRDDLRDGRYHYHTMTIMDYVEANNPSTWNLWEFDPTKTEDDLENRQDPFTGEAIGQKYVNIDFTRPVFLRGGFLGAIPLRTALYKVISTDKNPAFDLRWIKRPNRRIDWKHIGRKYYYDVPDHVFAIAGQNKEPHISSRGVSMYIIEKLMRELRPWTEVMEELNAIGLGEKGSGFDYGVRPWDMWGKVMPANVFEWRSMLQRINEIVRPKHSVEEYRDMYGKGWKT